MWTTYVAGETGGQLWISGSLRPAQLWLPLFLLRVAVVVVCLPGQGGTEVGTSAEDAKRG